MAKTKRVADPVVEAPVVENTEVTQEPVQLTVADLQLLARVVDLASTRGAFRANELSQVGDAYNKLSGFLAFVERQKAQELEAEGTATSSEEATPA